MSEAGEFSFADIENVISNAGDKFTVASLARVLGAPRSDVLRRRLERAVESDGSFFYDRKWNCISRKSFFNGRNFLITPDEWEISEGILFPGHRFVPFVSGEVFPSEVELSCDGKSVAMKKMTVPLGRLFRYHLLLGSEQIFDFLIAEDPANAHLSNHVAGTELVSLEVFDLKAFYAEKNFAFGDALYCEVTDHAAGKVKCSFLPAGQRSARDRKQRVADLDAGVKEAWEIFRDYPDIPEQLAWAEFFSGSKVAGASIDEFITASTVVELRADGDHAILAIRDESHDHAPDDILPSGLSISNADLDDPVKLLSGNGVPLNAAELDGFMLDAIYRRETDIDGVYSRIFGHKELDIKDEAQQAVLLNFLEERFEDLLENYNRVDDEPKAELRSDIVEAVENRLEFLSYLGSLDRDVNDEEKGKLEQLADISTKLSEALKLLNNPAFTPDSHELEHLSELVDGRLDEQDELLGDYRA